MSDTPPFEAAKPILPQPAGILAVLNQTKLAAPVRANIIDAFGPTFVGMVELLEKADTIKVEDATHVTEMKQARETRLALVKVRTGAGKIRDLLKEDALELSKTLDAIARMFASKCEPIEARLNDMEKTAERAEAKRKEDIKNARAAVLGKYGVDTKFIDLANMGADDFQTMLNDAKLAHEGRLAKAAKDAADLAAKQQADKAAADALALENKRLREANDAVEAQAKADRLAAQQAADALLAENNRKLKEANDALELERKKQRELEAEQKRERDAKAAQEAAEELARQQAAAAPDAEKLAAFAATVRGLEVPPMATEAGARTALDIQGLIEKLAGFVETRAAKIRSAQ